MQEQGLATAPDEEVAALAGRLQRTLLSQDLDFGPLFMAGRTTTQVVLLRSLDMRPGALNAMLGTLLKAVDLDDPAYAGVLVLADSRGHRVRRRA